MADYYAVLKRTLSGFGEPSESLRSKIYDKARGTIARQLDATQPPLSDETKAAQLAQLDDAIERMEREYAGPPADDFIGDPPPLPMGGGTEEPAPDALPEPAREPTVEEPVLERAPEPVAPPVEDGPVVSEAGPLSEPEPEPASPPEPEPVDSPSPAPVREIETPEPVDVVEDVPRAPVEPVFEAPEPVSAEPPEPLAAASDFQVEGPQDDEAPAVDDPLADAFAAIENARSGGTLPTSPESTDDRPSFEDDTFDPAAFDAAARAELDAPVVPFPGSYSMPGVDEPAHPVEDNSQPPVSVGEPSAREVFDDPEVAKRDAAALAAAPVTLPRERSGGRGVLAFLLIVAAIGLLFLFRAPLLAAVGVTPSAVDRFLADLPVVGPYLVGEVDDPDDPTRPTPVPTIRITPDPEPVVEDEAKREQRLGPDGQEVDPAAGREEVNTLPVPTVPGTGDEASEPAPVDTPAAEPETAAGTVPITPAEPAAPEVALNEPATEPEATAGTETPPIVVAQSAVLYEEGSGTRETRSDRGAVVWSIVEESPGNGEPAEPAIRAELDVPDRDLKATITLRRNTDKALAASHLMEVNFQPAAGFSGQNIDEVLSVRMKTDERGQGSPLSLIPAKIAPGYFYIALDNLPSARDRNVELLRSAKFIDIPVEYVTGRRALVSLEKGVVGERVFSEALTAWDAQAN